MLLIGWLVLGFFKKINKNVKNQRGNFTPFMDKEFN
jgi:hypothetical protein